MIVSKDKDFIRWCRRQRNYGKELVDGTVTYQALDGFNFRISEITACIGCIQLHNFREIVLKKRALAQKYDEIFPNRVYLPEGMKSGYYKYVVFDEKLAEETGKVYSCSNQCHVIDQADVCLPNCTWVGNHQACPPIYVGWEHAEDDVEALADYLLGGKKSGR